MSARVIALFAALVLLGSVLSVPSPVSPAPPRPTPVGEAANTALALWAARSQGSRVEVADLRTSTRAVYANPGGTLTAELSVLPTRAKQGNNWVPIDTSVVPHGDGTLGPRSADGGLSLSRGGSTAPLARMVKDGKSVALYWPGELPVPRTEGATVTYADVLAGVDLVMYVEPNGYRQHLVVRTAEAARNPALAKIALRTETKGLRLTADAAGVVRVVDEADNLVFVAPPSQMWDSSGPVPARSAAVKVTVQGESLVLQPDAALLADPAAVFPIVIDPDMRTWDKTNWASIASGRANTAFWWRSAAPNGGTVAQVGQCYNDGGECGSPSIGELWAYFQFDTSFVAGKHILGAEFKSVVVHSPSCAARAHQLFVVPHGGQIHPGMTWNNALQGGAWSEVGSPGAHDGCPGHKPIGFPVPAGIGAVTSYFMKAGNGGDQLAWRKYDPAQTRLFVHFNTTPNVPDQLATDPPLPSPCRWCAGRPYIGDASIRILTRLSDPDGDQVRPQWRYSFDGVEKASWNGALQVSGATHDATIPLQHNTKVAWWVHAYDDVHSSVPSHGPEFMVDLFAPKQKPKVSGDLYQEDGRWHGGVNVPGTFQFAADPQPGEANDINHYLYGWSPSPTTRADAQGALGGGASATLTPPGDGPQTLYVQAVDRAGHRSPTREYRIYVRAGNGPLAQWSFEGNTNDTAFLGDRHGTLNGTASYGSGAIGTGLQLDRKEASNVSAPNAVRTDVSFSVSAWVKLDQVPTEPTVFTAVSQEGSYLSSFFLSYRTESGGVWEFKTPSADAALRPSDEFVQLRIPAQLNTWTHIAGVYDASAKQIRLYVNGVPSAPVARNLGFHATGPVMVGRAKWDAKPVNFWPGGIDEVQMYDRVVSEAEVKSLVSKDNVQVAHWQFEDSGGRTAVNAVTGGQHGVLSGGAEFTDRGAVGRAVHLNGSDGQVVTSGPVLRTDQSFSVAAWVWADRFVTGGASMTAVSQDGNANSGFYLKYDSGHRKWIFCKMTTDDNTPAGVGALARQEPIAESWVHLTGVFDAPSKQLRIYVNGEDGGSVTLTESLWNASGSLAIGRAKLRGAAVDYWPGSVDEVRMYSRILSVAEIRGIISQNNVTAGAWKLDGNATDSSGRGLHGTCGGTQEWAAGQTSNPAPSDLAVKLDGTTSHVSAPHTVDTDKSFSVAVWARLDRTGKSSVVVSQDGTYVGGFFLYALPDGRWSLAKPHMDRLDSPGDGVEGPAAQVGVWTHLAGVYSKERQRLELYVNGVLAGSIAHTTGFNAAGALQIGRRKGKDNHVDYFPGAIDDVSVYSRALFTDEIRVMAGRDLSLVHNWQLDETSGRNAADAIGARNGTLHEGARFGPGRVGNAVFLNGSTDNVATTGVDIRTDQSFTVSSWVRLEDNDCPQVEVRPCRRDAVTVDGSHTSKFRLGHVVDNDQAIRGKWVFEMPEADTDQAPVTEAALSVDPGEVGAWVLLTGVYDAATKKIWLYVNGDRVDDGTVNTPWPATGALRLGRGKAAGQAANFWPGGVDDVRLYTGVQDKDRVLSLRRSYPPEEAPPTLPVADAGRWRFDEASGTTAADSSPHARNATLRGGAGWHSARNNSGLQLDGATGYAETAGPVLATDQSFSVAAWAFASTSTGARTIVGQDGAQASTFALQYRPSDARWIVRVPTEDIVKPATVSVTSTESALVGQWTHLTVTYDAPQKRLQLYVNGALSAVQLNVIVRGSSGALSVGRSKWNGANAELFGGFIDDVRAYGKTLSDGEVRKVYDDVYLGLHGHWRFDGTGADTSWRQNPTTVSGTPSYTTGVDDRALQLDGTSVAAKAQHVGVPMIGSFTVSAWAKLARTDRVQTVLSEEGVRMSGFVLQYRPDSNRWVFGAPAQDADGAAMLLATSPQPPKLNSWTHLAGVYDYPGRQLRLYVDGELAGVRNNVSLWAAWRGFTIGRGKVNDEPAEFFAGAIDDVITDMGAASDAEIARRAGSPAPPGPSRNRVVDRQRGHLPATLPEGTS